jgi:hypothetical protein
VQRHKTAPEEVQMSLVRVMGTIARFVYFGNESRHALVVQDGNYKVEYARLSGGWLEPHSFALPRLEQPNTQRPEGKYSTRVLYDAMRAFDAGNFGFGIKDPNITRPAWDIDAEEFDIVNSYANGIFWKSTSSPSRWNFRADRDAKTSTAKVHSWTTVHAAYSLYDTQEFGGRNALRISLSDGVIAEARGSSRVYAHPSQRRGDVPNCGPKFLKDFLEELRRNNLLPRDASFGWHADAEQRGILATAIAKLG